MTPTEPLPSISAPESTSTPSLVDRIKALSWTKIKRSPWSLVVTLIILAIPTSLLLLSWFKSASFPLPSPLPTLEPAPSLPPSSPSPFATDSAILEIGQNLQDLSPQLDQADMTETNLFPPVLDLNINFE